MFDQTDLQELLEFDAGSDRILSLYLNTDTAQQSVDEIKLRVRGLLKEAEANTKHKDDVAEIERYFEHAHNWSKPGLALFSCAGQDFFRTHPVAVPFRNRLRIGTRPYVKPLLHLMEYYAHYGVILVDRIGARFFDFHLGELQSTGGTMGEEVQKLKHGGGSSATGMRGGEGNVARREEELMQRNMRDAAEAAAQFFAKRKIRRLFLGGTAENVAPFREMLPKQLQSCLAGTFPVDMDAGEHEVKERSLELMHRLNEQREEQLVDNMITTAAKGGTAVTGLAETLRMVSDGRVQTLVVSDGFRAPGYVHETSGYLTATADHDLFGNGEFMEVPDIVEKAINRTMDQSGHVEVISENPQLEAAGRIGALLRY